jgi:hypothetical protein
MPNGEERVRALAQDHVPGDAAELDAAAQQLRTRVTFANQPCVRCDRL